MNLPQRIHPRLKDFDYSQNGAYHIIIHALSDAPLFSVIYERNGEIMQTLKPEGEILNRVLSETEQRFDGITIACASVMPTHIHLLLCLENSASEITDFVRVFKSMATREANLAAGKPGRKIFQASFYEHIIRGTQDFNNTFQYIQFNAQKDYYRKHP